MDGQLNIKELLVELGEKVKAYRWDKRLTLDQLAEKAKVSTVLLSGIEKNELDNISLKKVIAITQAIDVNLQLTLTPVPEQAQA